MSSRELAGVAELPYFRRSPTKYSGEMAWLWLAFIGVPTGLVLDRLTVYFSTAPRDEDEDTGDGGGPSSAGNVTIVARNSWTRRIVIVSLTTGLFAVAGARFESPGHVTVVAAYISILIVCAATDALSFRVPNAVTYPAILLALILGFAMRDASARSVLVGGAIAAVVFLVPALLTGGVGIGIGDAKLAAFCGLALGLRNLVPTLLFAALLGGVAAAALLVTGLRGRRDPIPYAPFIAAATIAVLLWRGPAVAQLN